jgi:hypothetical protein
VAGRFAANWEHLAKPEFFAMPIDIDRLTEAELIDLNNRVVARLKFLSQMRAHAHMLEFRIGEKVSFQPDGQPLLTGIIAKYNRKSVTVITENGQHWNVAPVFLRKASPPSRSAAGPARLDGVARK